MEPMAPWQRWVFSLLHREKLEKMRSGLVAMRANVLAGREPPSESVIERGRPIWERNPTAFGASLLDAMKRARREVALLGLGEQVRELRVRTGEWPGVASLRDSGIDTEFAQAIERGDLLVSGTRKGVLLTSVGDALRKGADDEARVEVWVAATGVELGRPDPSRLGCEPPGTIVLAGGTSEDLRSSARFVPAAERWVRMGLSVFEIERGTIADAMRLCPGDTISSVDGEPVNTIGDLVRLLERREDGTSRIALVRGGEELEASIRW